MMPFKKYCSLIFIFSFFALSLMASDSAPKQGSLPKDCPTSPHAKERNEARRKAKAKAKKKAEAQQMKKIEQGPELDDFIFAMDAIEEI